jgi:valyl-tRNA synthetase
MLVRDNDGNVLHSLLIDFDYASTLEKGKRKEEGKGEEEEGEEEEEKGKGKEKEKEADADVVDRFRTVSLLPFAFSFIYSHRREHHHLWPSRFCCKGVDPSITAFDMIWSLSTLS